MQAFVGVGRGGAAVRAEHALRAAAHSRITVQQPWSAYLVLHDEYVAPLRAPPAGAKRESPYEVTTKLLAAGAAGQVPMSAAPYVYEQGTAEGKPCRAGKCEPAAPAAGLIERMNLVQRVVAVGLVVAGSCLLCVILYGCVQSCGKTPKVTQTAPEPRAKPPGGYVPQVTDREENRESISALNHGAEPVEDTPKRPTERALAPAGGLTTASA